MNCLLGKKRENAHYVNVECNQEFFRARKISWSKDTSIDILSSTQKKNPTGKIFGDFLLDTLKTTFHLRNLTHK